MTGKYFLQSLAAGLFALVIVVTGPAYAASPVGVWLRDTGSSKIEIYRCGSRLCGKIVWLREPNDADGNPRTDVENPDPALRDQPLIGLQVILNMVQSGDNKWEGEVYKSDDGRIFSGNMRMSDDDTIALAGCVLGGLICRRGNLYRQ